MGETKVIDEFEKCANELLLYGIRQCVDVENVGVCVYVWMCYEREP